MSPSLLELLLPGAHRAGLSGVEPSRSRTRDDGSSADLPEAARWNGRVKVERENGDEEGEGGEEGGKEAHNKERRRVRREGRESGGVVVGGR